MHIWLTITAVWFVLIAGLAVAMYSLDARNPIILFILLAMGLLSIIYSIGTLIYWINLFGGIGAAWSWLLWVLNGGRR